MADAPLIPGMRVAAPVYGQLLPTEGALASPFELDGGLWLESTPRWFRDAVPSDFSLGLKDRNRVLTASHLLWQEGCSPRQTNEEDAEQITFRLAQHSLWIATSVPVEWDLAFYLEWPSETRGSAAYVRCGGERVPLRAHDPRLTLQGLQDTRSILPRLRASRGTALWAASRMSRLALDHRHGDVAMVLLWSALESLFAPEGSQETTFQISMSLALFLGADRTEAAALARRVKESYRLRCKVVHGTARGLAPRDAVPQKKALDLLAETMEWLRTALKRIFLDDSLRATFSSEPSRVKYLRELPYATH